MPSTVEIRSARQEDLEAMAILAGKLVREHHGYDARRFLLVESVERGYGRFFAGEVKDAEAVLLAAEAPDGTIAGYAYGRMEARDWNNLLDACGYLHDVYVDESWRKQGVARALCEAMFSRLEALGAPRVVLMSAWPNHGAQSLFRSLGFRETMVEMTRELASR